MQADVITQEAFQVDDLLIELLAESECAAMLVPPHVFAPELGDRPDRHDTSRRRGRLSSRAATACAA